tara:strand:- start:1849 stop:2469 length:621 start_codon:yes stop_codon:yes gene_type:complete
MSCKGIGKAFSELAGGIDEISAKFDTVIDELADGVADSIGLTAAKVKFDLMLIEIEAAFQKEFPNLESFFEQLKEGIPLSQELETIMNLGAQSVAALDKINELKAKYGSDSVVDDILNDPAGFIEGLGGDLEALCEAMPNYEKAKDGTIKVKAAKFNFDGAEIDVEEILSEGLSPTIRRLKDSLKNLTVTFESASVMDKDLANPYS